MRRGRIIGIIVFIAFGLFMFTFANPNEEVNDNTKTSEEITSTSNDETKKSSDKTEVIQPSETEQNNDNLVTDTFENTNPTLISGATVINNGVDNNTKQNDNVISNNENNKINENNEINNVVDDIENKIDTSLDELKKEAISALNDYLNSKKFSENYLDDAKKILEETIVKINDAKTKETIKDLLDSSKKQLDVLKDEEKIENYKRLAKEDITKYKDNLNISKDYIEEIDNIINKSFNAINLAKDFEVVDVIVGLAKEELDTLKEKQILNNEKALAKEELDNYIENMDLYREEQQNQINEIISSSKEEIEEATSKDIIDEIVNNAKEKLDSIKTDEELYLEETVVVTFKDRKGSVIKKERVYIGSSALNIAPSIELSYEQKGITYTFTSWSESLDEVKTDITVSPIYNITKVLATVYELSENESRPQLDGTGNSYTKIGTLQLKINDEIKKVINENKRKVLTNTISSYLIDEKQLDTSCDDNFKILEYYVIKYEPSDGFHIDRQLITDVEALNNYRLKSTNEISNYVDKSDYRTEEQKLINEIITESTKNINNSTSKVEIDKIVESAKSSIDKLTTNEQYLNESRNNAIKQIEDYIKSFTISIDSYKEEVFKILDKYSSKINSDNDEVNYPKYIQDAKKEIDSLITKMNSTFSVSILNPRGDWNYKYLYIDNIEKDVVITKVTFVYNKTKDVVFNGNLNTNKMIDKRLKDSKTVEIEYTKSGIKYLNVYNVLRTNHKLYKEIIGLELISSIKK